MLMWSSAEVSMYLLHKRHMAITPVLRLCL